MARPFPAVAAGKEPVLSNRSEGLPMPNYGHEKGSERGIEQEAMSEGRVRVGVWLTTGHSNEQRRTHQQRVPVPIVRISCVKCARAVSEQLNIPSPLGQHTLYGKVFQLEAGNLVGKRLYLTEQRTTTATGPSVRCHEPMLPPLPTTGQRDQANYLWGRRKGRSAAARAVRNTATPAPLDRVKSG